MKKLDWYPVNAVPEKLSDCSPIGEPDGFEALRKRFIASGGVPDLLDLSKITFPNKTSEPECPDVEVHIALDGQFWRMSYVWPQSMTIAQIMRKNPEWLKPFMLPK